MHAKTLEAAAALALYESGDPHFKLLPSFLWPNPEGKRFLKHSKPIGPGGCINVTRNYEVFLYEEPNQD